MVDTSDDDPTVMQSSSRRGDGKVSPRSRTSLRDLVGDEDDATVRRNGGDDDPTIRKDQGSDDPTVVVSSRGGQSGAPVATGTESGDASGYDMLLRRQPQRNDEILLVCAEPLLVLAAELRNSVEFADIDALRRRVSAEIERFEERATKMGASAGEITAGRYVLCSLIDEIVLTTPWGSRSTWSNQSLLSEYHGETWGGEKVFQLLDRIMEQPKKYLAVLRLIDACLVLGFEGRYRVVEGGRDQLENVRTRLGRTLREYLPAPPDQLSARWEGPRKKRSIRTFVPLWVAFTASAVLIVLLYVFFQIRLQEDLGPVLTTIQSLQGQVR
ncbi:type IVB secretion system protein IcmH/DotU [Amorphus orientalis]|uniref:Type VI secretion system protein ImpK n=1 Tax=Amorphus orientalis TaxID=649198 RepID=A0AAE3VLT3_9HYPH|nr:type IVB secretion system protein IcmH/DotU [Amorphus orientalis]MDQ0314298.1 type VI secretion system protein ImpK [Amorphus orientalis]